MHYLGPNNPLWPCLDEVDQKTSEEGFQKYIYGNVVDPCTSSEMTPCATAPIAWRATLDLRFRSLSFSCLLIMSLIVAPTILHLTDNDAATGLDLFQ